MSNSFSGHVGMTRYHNAILALLSLVYISSVAAIWPLTSKEAKPEGFINVGSLGLESEVGKVVAFGDWDGDQGLDLFTLSKDRKTLTLHLWDPFTHGFRASHQLASPSPIANVIPADFNQDGRLDVLLFQEREQTGDEWWSKKENVLDAVLYTERGDDGSFGPTGTLVDTLTTTQPLLFDSDGDLQLDMLAYVPGELTSAPVLTQWQGRGSGFERASLPFNPPDKVCEIAHPHSNAFIDLDGDCLPDVFLVCGTKGSRKKSFQIWTKKKDAGFHFAGEWDLPDGTGAISFADMDRDGTIDLVFPSCASHSSSSGIGLDCTIHIAYNKQKPLCSMHSGSWLGGLEQAVITKPESCRKPEELCTADEDFGFDLSEGSDALTSIPLDTLFPRTTSILFSEPTTSTDPTGSLIPLRIGDYNLDGFPDIALLLVNSTAAPPSGGIFGGGRSSGVQPRLLKNVICDKKAKECGGEKWKLGRRMFEVVKGAEVDVLDEIWDARNLAWVDVDEDGSLDLLVQRSGQQTEQQITFVKNNIFHDAFFLKTLVLNGACEGDCEPVGPGKSYPPHGANMIGATLKFSLLDTNGQRRATQVSQMPQTGYHALQTPYTFFGLGRTNNYVENLFIGSSLHGETAGSHFTNIEGVIPNSQIVIYPPSPKAETGDGEEGGREGPGLLVRNPSKAWKTALYLHPGEWIPWVVGTMVLIVTGLCAVAYGLRMNERREDENERRRAMHRINFVAM